MKLFSEKYGLRIDQTERLYKDGMIGFKPLRDAEIAEHYREQLEFYQGKRMDAMFDTCFHYELSPRSVYRALKIWG